MKPNTLTKHISYCYPNSIYARLFGSSGFFVEHNLWNVDGKDEVKSDPHESAFRGMVFPTKDDPSLLAILETADGELSPHYR